MQYIILSYLLNTSNARIFTEYIHVRISFYIIVIAKYEIIQYKNIKCTIITYFKDTNKFLDLSSR